MNSKIVVANMSLLNDLFFILKSCFQGLENTQRLNIGDLV